MVWLCTGAAVEALPFRLAAQACGSGLRRSLDWVDLLTDAVHGAGQPEGAHCSRAGPMLGLTVVLPALLFGIGTVLLSAREESALRSGLVLRQVRQSAVDGPPDGGSMRKVR